MRDDFLDIVAVIVRQMAEERGRDPHDRSIIEGLLDEGYDLMDIDDALSWFESLGGSAVEASAREFWPGFKGTRVMARWEREAMSPGAYLYLMKLSAAGLIDDSFREAILDRISDLSLPDFGIEQMKALIGLVLYSKGRETPNLPLTQMLNRGEGSGLLN